MEASRQCQIPWNWSNKQLWTNWHGGEELKVNLGLCKCGITLNCPATSQGPEQILLKCLPLAVTLPLASASSLMCMPKFLSRPLLSSQLHVVNCWALLYVLVGKCSLQTAVSHSPSAQVPRSSQALSGMAPLPTIPERHSPHSPELSELLLKLRRLFVSLL